MSILIQQQDTNKIHPKLTSKMDLVEIFPKQLIV